MKKLKLALSTPTPLDAAASPPAGLSEAALFWWQALRDEYGIRDSYGALLLGEVATNFDRAERARKLIEQHGEVIEEEGKLKRNPACSVEAAARHAMLQAARALNIDLEPLRDGPGRPPGGR